MSVTESYIARKCSTFVYLMSILLLDLASQKQKNFNNKLCSFGTGLVVYQDIALSVTVMYMVRTIAFSHKKQRVLISK
ncbi:hypothetical protein AQUCO_04200189v1 [Aquilegia coerulea]|uniref:Uncharacterized protein n=1 Tax=Aquilegia coerulea TaxID=218851 RepID=A0A2G5CPN3_AQUCA|nr:hypothetical protein AQUCO_04200189v1 [Aquilegia coerulea]